MTIRPETHFTDELRKHEDEKVVHELNLEAIEEQDNYLYREALTDSAAFQTMQDDYEVVDMDLLRVALWQVEEQMYDDAQASMRLILNRMKRAAKHEAEKTPKPDDRRDAMANSIAHQIEGR